MTVPPAVPDFVALLESFAVENEEIDCSNKVTLSLKIVIVLLKEPKAEDYRWETKKEGNHVAAVE